MFTENQKLHEMIRTLRGENEGLCAENQKLHEMIRTQRGENEGLCTQNVSIRSNAETKEMSRMAKERGLVHAAKSLFSHVDRMTNDHATRSAVRVGQGRADQRNVVTKEVDFGATHDFLLGHGERLAGGASQRAR